MAEWPRQWYSCGLPDLKEGLLMPSNQPQKTGIAGLLPVTLMVALSSMFCPPKHWKESLWLIGVIPSSPVIQRSAFFVANA